eukprot:CAMPEP_0170790828 /NCGR_PEP_ID=MMETSP0733-20121128/20736_1 /TAXON_ID=186038 /ORGANISM="Fragilariopsis kerguelensis, Strain L26-C5" /LENGTH=49 /DNA_ID= /DNA_START= /DNA_END= /DNA_ORIENTATION=
MIGNGKIPKGTPAAFGGATLDGRSPWGTNSSNTFCVAAQVSSIRAAFGT